MKKEIKKDRHLLIDLTDEEILSDGPLENQVTISFDGDKHCKLVVNDEPIDESTLDLFHS